MNEAVNGWNPLYSALKYRHAATVKVLLELGADVFQTIKITLNGVTWTGNALTYEKKKIAFSMWFSYSHLLKLCHGKRIA